jgi:hypothetical protein
LGEDVQCLQSQLLSPLQFRLNNIKPFLHLEHQLAHSYSSTTPMTKLLSTSNMASISLADALCAILLPTVVAPLRAKR